MNGMSKFGITIVFLVIFVMLGSFCIYQWAGLKQYIGLVKYINTFSDETEKKETLSIFFDGPGRGYGGILAWIGKNGLWSWGKFGPKYFRYPDNPTYGIFYDCNQKKMSEYANGKGTNVRFERFSDLAIWKENVKIGMYVFIELSGRNEAIIYPDVNTETYPLVFCYLPVPKNK